MKPAIFLIVVVIVGVIGFLLFGSTSEAPTKTPEVEVSEMEDVIEVEPMPVPGELEPEMVVDTSDEVDMDAEEMVAEESVFAIDAFSFGYSETEIKVNVGDTVTINLTNSAGFHDWVVDEFSAATDKINVGETTSVTFVADKAGEYEFYCSVGNHRAQGMVGKLIVE